MNNIDIVRKDKKLSYSEIAKLTGLTSTYICLLAKNKRKNPSLDTMHKISKALGERVEKIFEI